MQHCEEIEIYDILIPQNQTVTLFLEFEDENDDAIDLTGSSFKFQVKDNYKSETTLLSASSDDLTGSRIEIEDQATSKGKAKLIIVGADTVGLKAKNTEVQDLLHIDANGEPKYWFKGKFVLSPTVSR